MSGTRFTTWLPEPERAGVRRLARQNQCSENFVIRVALRHLLFQEPIPPYLLGDTSNTSNAHQGVQQ